MYVNVAFSINMSPKPKEKIRSFTKRNFEKLKNKLTKHDWTFLEEIQDVDEAVDAFENIFFDFFERSFPLTNRKDNLKKTNLLPFFNEELKNLKHMKESLFRTYRSTCFESDFLRYKEARNLYRSNCRQAKRKYYFDTISKLKSKPKCLWNFLNEITGLGRNKNNNGVLDKVEVDGKVINDPQLIADEFNKYFSSIGQSIASKLPKSNTDFSEYIPIPCPQSFGFEPITPVETAMTIEKLKSSSANDINGLSNSFLKNIALEVAIPLSLLYNKSLTLGKYPTAWKISKVVPIFKKKGSPSVMSNYRPISVVNVFSKVIEILFQRRLMNYLEKKNYFSCFQFGFRESSSVQLAIVKYINDIAYDLNEGKLSASLFLDCEKAFDTVNRNILISKLENAGIRGCVISWLASYLNDRTQKVSLNGFISKNTCKVDVGVLQGSCLSASLFIFYINDLMKNSSCKVYCYADDANLYINEITLTGLQEKIKLSFSDSLRWYLANSISINSSKTELMVFNKSVKRQEHLELNLISTAGAFTIKSSESEVRYLGFYFDTKLNFESFFEKIIKRMSFGTFALNKFKNLLPEKTKLELYYAFVHSHINFSSLLYFSTTKKMQERLLKIQKTAVRTIKGQGNRSHTAEIFESLDILPFPVQAKLNIFNFMMSWVDKKYGNAFENQWVTNSYFHGNTTIRNSHKLRVPFTRVNKLKRLPYFVFPYIYNSLVDDFNDMPYDGRFALFKEMLLSKYVDNNRCRLSDCYVCKKYLVGKNLRIMERSAKLEKIKLIIKKKVN